jgi:hypothetical protein
MGGLSSFDSTRSFAFRLQLRAPWRLPAAKINAVIPPKSNRRFPAEFDRGS